MTYALAWPLQQALYELLSQDPALQALIGTRVYDAPPPMAGEPAGEDIYLTLGDETAADASTASDRGALHQVLITVNAPRRGFAEAKRVAGAICDALLPASLTMSRGHAIDTRFVSARTLREEAGALRRIELRFTIVTEDGA